MTPERWRQISGVFHVALGHDDATRPTYLDRACADDEGLRVEVDALLAAHERAGRFGEQPIFASGIRAPSEPPARSAPLPAVEETAGRRLLLRERFVWLVWFAAFVTAAAFSYATVRLIEQGFTLPYTGWSETRFGATGFISAVDPEGPAANRVRPGDEIVSLNGSPRLPNIGTRLHRARLAPGDSYELTVRHAGELKTLQLDVVASRAELPLRIGWFLVSLAWCAVGFFVGFARPEQPLARLAFASTVATGLVIFQIGVVRGGVIWQPLQMVLWYHFFARFPSGAPLYGARRIVLLSLYGVAFVAAPLGAAQYVAFLLNGVDATLSLRARQPLFLQTDWFSFVAWIGSVVATFVVTRANFRRLTDRDQRRRIRWVIYSASVAVVPMFIALLVVVLFPPQVTVGARFDGGELLLYAFTTAIPLSVAYAVVRHRVFDIRVVVRRGVQYLLARRALQLFVILPVAAWIYTIVANRDRTIAELVTESTAHFYWIAAALLALRFRRPIQLWLDRKFFREEFDREQMLIGLVDELGNAESIAELSSLVRAKLEPALHPASVLVWYRDPGELAVASASNPQLVPPDFPGGGRWLAWLEEQGSAVDLPLPTAAGLSERDSRWLEDRGVALVVPIRDSADCLVGVLLLGGKRSEEPYTSGDSRFLDAVAKQLAVNRENLRLRTRLSEELRVRRDVLARLDERLPDLLKECPACGACFSGVLENCSACGHTLGLSLPITRTLDGRYRLDRLLGKGGMGAVYAAHDLRLDREVAVKVMLSRAFGQPGALRRFHREARAAARVSHRNIVTVYDVGSLEGEGAYIVMERVPGETLRAALDREHKLSPAAAAEWFEPLLDGLAAAHERGIVHRDLKPENVMGHREVSGALAVKILDLGLVKLRTTEQGASDTLTQDGIVMGTPDYMPPEQLLGRDVDARADLFAVGVMLLETLSGQKSPRDKNGARAPVPADAPPSGARSAALDELLRRCLAADPRDRATSAAALRDQLIPLLRCESAS